MKKKSLKKTLVLIALNALLLYAFTSHAQQINSGSEVFEAAFDEVSSWKDWIDKLLYLVAAIVLSTGVVKIVIKILTKESGERTELGGEIGRWLLTAGFIAAAGVITSLFAS